MAPLRGKDARIALYPVHDYACRRCGQDLCRLEGEEKTKTQQNAEQWEKWGNWHLSATTPKFVQVPRASPGIVSRALPSKVHTTNCFIHLSLTGNQKYYPQWSSCKTFLQTAQFDFPCPLASLCFRNKCRERLSNPSKMTLWPDRTRTQDSL